MIHVELSVEPHYKECKYGDDPLKPLPNTPPHVIIKQEFEKWDEARVFCVDVLQLKTDSQGLEELFDEALHDNEYVQVEMDLLEVTGRLYTNACLAIEGQE